MEFKISNDQSDEQHGTKATSTINPVFPVACDIKSPALSTLTSDVNFAPIKSISRTEQELRLSRRKSFERPFSSIDPESARVSTILVWQNLTVKTREDKRNEFFQRFRPYKDFESKQKVLLHNLSGAITGGLWAVMGKSFASLFNVQLVSHRTIRFRQINSLEYIGMSFGCQHSCPW
jgi:hypothetical protein